MPNSNFQQIQYMILPPLLFRGNVVHDSFCVSMMVLSVAQIHAASSSLYNTTDIQHRERCEQNRTEHSTARIITRRNITIIIIFIGWRKIRTFYFSFRSVSSRLSSCSFICCCWWCFVVRVAVFCSIHQMSGTRASVFEYVRVRDAKNEIPRTIVHRKCHPHWKREKTNDKFRALILIHFPSRPPQLFFASFSLCTSHSFAVIFF